MEIGFSLGSNLGDRHANLIAARDLLVKVPGTHLLAQSSLYETEPVGVYEAYAHLFFLNAVVVIDSDKTCSEWLTEIARIEQGLGRARTEDQNAPRSIDVDILYAGAECIDGGGLTVPHPRWAERRFVVVPLAEVRPDLVLPGTGRSVREVLGNLSESEEVRLFAETW